MRGTVWKEADGGFARKIPDHRPINLDRPTILRATALRCSLIESRTVTHGDEWPDGVVSHFLFRLSPVGDRVLVVSLKACLPAPQSPVLLPFLVSMASSEHEQRPDIVRNPSDDSVQEVAASSATPSTSQPLTPRTAYQRFQLPNVVANFSPGIRSSVQSGFFAGDASEQSSIVEGNRPGTGFSSKSPSVITSSVITRDSFMSPPVRPTTVYQSLNNSKPPPKTTKPSTMLTGEIEKPWKSQNNSQMRLAYWITYAAAAFGIVAGALRCYFGWKSVPRLGNLCQVMEDDFETLNQDIWSYDIDLGGFGCVIFPSIQWPIIHQTDRPRTSGTVNSR